MDVVDYAWERPPPAILAKLGYQGVCRYLSHEPAKNLSISERDQLHGAGLGIGLVWETTANRALTGFSGGRADALEANEQADALEWPRDAALTYAVDFDAGPSHFNAIREYFRGALSVSRRPVGVYGSYWTVEDLAEHQPVRCYWQCAAWSGSGIGTGGSIYVPEYGYRVRVSIHACLFQFFGSTKIDGTDHNVSLNPTIQDFLWFPHEQAVEEDDMAPPVIMKTKTDSLWAVAVGGAQPGEQVRVLAYPSSGIMVRVWSDEQVAGDLFFGIKDLGEVEDRFFYNYTFSPWSSAPPPAVMVRNRPDSQWSRDVAKLGPGEQARFLVWPQGPIVRIHDDEQFNGNKFIGVRDRGVMDDQWFYNHTLAPWAST